MSFLSLEMNVFLMFLLVVIGIMTGYQLAFVLAGIGVFFGVSLFGIRFMGALMMGFMGTIQSFTLLAIPLFILMGNIMMLSGIGEQMFNSLYILFGRVKGGLSIATTVLATMFATCTGVVGASVVTVGSLGIPAMLKHKYDRKLAFGTVCAGGCLGVLIPPSVLMIIYGATAGLSVGNIFIAAIIPSLLLSLAYILYAFIRCWLNPALGPTITKEEREEALRKTPITKLMLAIVPPLFIILAVLGSIFFGFAAPTEAAAVGCIASIVLAMFYRKLSLENLRKATLDTMIATSSILFMTVGAVMFTSTFASMGGVELVRRTVLELDLGPHGTFLLMAGVLSFLGLFMDWIGVIYLTIPIFTPIAASLGFDPIWFAIMMILFLQLSYLTPPFALACFYCKGIAPADTTISELYVAVVPYIVIQLFAFAIFYAFPSIITFLPGLGLIGG